MSRKRLLARAKVNLTLEILGKRADGYHDLRSFVVPVSLADEIFLESSVDVSLDVCTAADAPVAIADLGALEDNLALRAARLVKARTGVEKGVGLTLVKRIPAGAGLGGGSADAAAVLKGLSEFWRLGLSTTELMSLGAELGSDVPALVHGGAVIMEGRGERVTPISAKTEVDLVLAFPGIVVSTAKVYKHCVPQLTNGGQIVDNMHHAFLGGEPVQIAAALQNGLSVAAMALHPEIARVQEALGAAGALGVSMTGSGSCVFGVVDDEVQANQVVRRLAACGLAAVAVRTCPVM